MSIRKKFCCLASKLSEGLLTGTTPAMRLKPRPAATMQTERNRIMRRIQTMVNAYQFADAADEIFAFEKKYKKDYRCNGYLNELNQALDKQKFLIVNPNLNKKVQ